MRTNLLPLSPATNLVQQAIFLHDMQDRFGIVVNTFAVSQPQPPIAIGMKAFVLPLPNDFSKSSILFRASHRFYKAVIAAFGHPKELAQNKHRILLSVTVDYCILRLCSHFLSVDCRKSRSDSLSTRSLRISQACSATGSLGIGPFVGRPDGCGRMPASGLLYLRRSRFSKYFTTSLSLNPKCSAIPRCVFPC